MKIGRPEICSWLDKQISTFSPIWADVYSLKMFMVSFSLALAGIAQVLLAEFLTRGGWVYCAMSLSTAYEINIPSLEDSILVPSSRKQEQLSKTLQKLAPQAKDWSSEASRPCFWQSYLPDDDAKRTIKNTGWISVDTFFRVRH